MVGLIIHGLQGLVDCDALVDTVPEDLPHLQEHLVQVDRDRQVLALATEGEELADQVFGAVTGFEHLPQIFLDVVIVF